MNKKTNYILVVEDDIALNDAICEALVYAKHKVKKAYSVAEAEDIIIANNINLIISDIHMKGKTGHDLLKHIKIHYSYIPVILITAYGTIQDAVNAMKLGAQDYIVKPFEAEVLITTAEKHIKNKSELVLTKSKSATALFATLKKVAVYDAYVLLEGESGVGKEVIAKYIHEYSSRKDKPFVAINCAAIPENMLEAVLFGYEKGAFTGAVKSMPGKFELAQNGSILLDEISEMDKNLQTKLLRVLQEKEVERLGSKNSISLDVRVIATTNRNLKKEVELGSFRKDLYYRLSVFPIYVPPLRERIDDIIPLALHFVTKYTKNYSEQKFYFSKDAELMLMNYEWPGNIRELENVIQRALIMCSTSEIFAKDLMLQNKSTIINKPNKDLSENIRSHEFNVILSELTKHNGNRMLVAKSLGISPRTLRYKLAKMKELGIKENEYVN